MPACVPASKGQLAERDLRCQRRVDVLEMHVADAVGVVAGEGDGVGAADEQVPGVQAPRHVGGTSARSTSSAVSTSVVTCGCRTSR